MIKIAHRGYASDNHLENSYDAVLKAIELGYDMVEIDIRETKDRKMVLSHDRDLNRVFNLNKKIRNMTLKEIKDRTDGKILTLKDCFEICKGKVGLLIEIKDKQYSEDFLEKIHHLVQNYNLVSQVWLYPPREDLINFYLGRIKVGIGYNKVKKLSGEENLADKVFVLGMPGVWSKERIRGMHKNDLLCLTTVKRTYFERNFSEDNHLRLAEKTIERLKRIGLDAVNIDSCYHQFLFNI